MEYDTTIFRRHLIMSTRCNIYIHDCRNNSSLWIYHHHDGYPEGVGKQLKDFLSNENNRILSPDDMLDGLIYIYGTGYEKTEHQHGDVSYRYDIEIMPLLTTLAINEMSHIYDGNWNGGFRCETKELEKIEYINNTLNISSEKNHEYINQTSWKVSDLKKMYARINYIDILDLMDSGILDNISDDMEINENTIREKIIQALLKEFEKNVSIELVEKQYIKNNMKSFIKIENESGTAIVSIDDIVVVDFYPFDCDEKRAKLDIWIKNCKECLEFVNDIDKIKVLYDKIENAMSNYYNIFIPDALCQNTTKEKPPKIAKKLPDLDKCVLITED